MTDFDLVPWDHIMRYFTRFGHVDAVQNPGELRGLLLSIVWWIDSLFWGLSNLDNAHNQNLGMTD